MSRSFILLSDELSRLKEIMNDQNVEWMMNEWMNEWMNDQIMNEWMNEWSIQNYSSSF